MIKNVLPLIFFICLLSCKNKDAHTNEDTISEEKVIVKTEPFTVVFASCNDQDRPQPLWKPIIENKPDLFIWGGDNVYADTEDMEKMEADYDKVKANVDYKELMSNTTIIGTWDDHDYGKNDAGINWEHKEEAKTKLLNFLEVPETDSRYTREGVYTSEIFKNETGSVKIILLDTRSFRTGLKKSTIPGRRYEAWNIEDGGSVLGDVQWDWLANELKDDSTDFTVIVTSIQFLSDKHGWEKWGNHPSEVEKMNTLLKNAASKNILMLSGDRHHAEFSVKNIPGLSYPLVDFTSSGLTHTFPGDPMDENPFRVKEGTKDLNFGVLSFNFDTMKVAMQIRGLNNVLIEEFTQQY